MLKKTREENTEFGPFIWEEKALFEKTAKEHFSRYYPLFMTALRAGMRIGEILAPQAGDMDFNSRFIEVKRNFAKGRLTTPKSGKVLRVDMSSGLADVLEAYPVEREEETIKKGWGEPAEWLFSMKWESALM